ncbi:N-acetyltransferase B complex non catalytic subunit-domain-containing protein [Dichotomopilus funicola]|uniref:N-acetyltransferase B complex non catalytic subunit-domain-containing protein n=1 Tax=Dichotomopilus funicola TaxID=1934379 RepID=A0AAN6V112_9PEZI|nr:N-acetyltransferase B complex non catalytic subunit-domain-containing protein [Dichotomopilus funicola]
MSSYRYGRPALKNSVDVQLQTAFSDGNWNTVIRLATKRAATLKDPYYEAIKMAAEAQLENTAEKCAVFGAIEELVKDKKSPDIDTIELYEWACRDFFDAEVEYADSLGPLRARWAKANPSSPLALQCLRSCLEKWDLVSAQQIATSLDKAYANTSDRRYMFWNITLTFLLSISPQCTDASRKVYSLLAVRQLERAADLTENSAKLEVTDRGLLAEEEVCLYYRVLRSHGTKEEFISRLKSPKLGAINQLKQNRKVLFWEALEALETWGEWDLINNLCREALSLGLEGEKPSFFVCDLQIWKKFALAASKVEDSESALNEVQAVLKKYIDIKDQASAMYKKNISLALLETTFRLPTGSAGDETGGLSPRVAQIGRFLDQYFERLSAFEDVKSYVAELSFDEVKSLLDEVIPKVVDEGGDKAKKIVLRTLEYRLRYLLSTCPQTLSPQLPVEGGQPQEQPSQCRICTKAASIPCLTCLKKLVVEAAATYNQITGDKELLEAIPRLDKDPRLDLALVLGMSLLKLSGLTPGTSDTNYSLWESVDLGVFLQAVLVLDAQLQKTPEDIQLRLLLVQLYLLLGCASYAYQLWTPLEVKRTIQDALSPLFFDRISDISPGLFQGPRPLMEPLRSYYKHNLGERSPVRIWDAFSAGSYTSIFDMTNYDHDLRRSSTLMMTLVEERRAIRCYGGKIDSEIDQHPLTGNINGGTVLVNKTDYGSFANLESAHGPPVQEYLRLGPGLSNERSHLAYLSEQFLDLLLYKPPKEHKLAKQQVEAARHDREYTLETLERLSNSLADILHQPDTPSRLTRSETSYYTVLSHLAAGLLVALSTPRSDPIPKSLSHLTASIKTTFTTLRSSLAPISTTEETPTTNPPAIPTLTSMPALSYLRLSSLAIRSAATFLTASHDRELARNRTGRSGVHRDALAEMRGLDANVAVKGLAEVKGTVLRLKEALGEGGWLDRVLDLVFGGEEEEEMKEEGGGGGGEVRRAVEEVVGGRGGAEEWAGKVVESWREGVMGWGMVRME